MSNLEEVRLLDAIRRSPGQVLKHYTLQLDMNLGQGRDVLDRLINAGKVKRHSFNEQLSIPGAATTPPATPKKADSPRYSDVPAFGDKPSQDPLKMTDLHRRILVMLNSEQDAASTTAIAAVVDRQPTGLGPALNTLVQHGLVILDGVFAPKRWLLTDEGRRVASQLCSASAIEHTTASDVSDSVVIEDVRELDHDQENLDRHDAAQVVMPGQIAPDLEYQALTDKDIDLFLDLPVDFKSMLQAVHRAGYVTGRRSAPEWQGMLDKFEDIHGLLRRCAAGI